MAMTNPGIDSLFFAAGITLAAGFLVSALALGIACLPRRSRGRHAGEPVDLSAEVAPAGRTARRAREEQIAQQAHILLPGPGLRASILFTDGSCIEIPVPEHLPFVPWLTELVDHPKVDDVRVRPT